MNIATVIQAFVSILWLVVVGLIVLAVLRASRGYKVRSISITILAVAIIAVVLTSISAGLVFIQPEQRGVVISAIAPDGYRTQALQPGLNWIVPFMENVVVYQISQQTYTMSIMTGEGNIPGDDSISARTSDGQEVFIDSSVIFSVDPEEVIKVHIAWQDRYIDDLVRPLARGVIRDAISQFGVEEVYSSKRNELKAEITTKMGENLQENGLLLGDFVLRNITFSPEYAASVEQKQIAEQQAQQAKFVVEQRKQEAEQARQLAQGQADAVVIQAEGNADARIIEAEAEANALQKISGAISDNPEILSYLYISKINPGVQVMLLPNEDINYFYPLPNIGPTEMLDIPPTPTPQPTPTTTPSLPEPTPRPMETPES